MLRLVIMLAAATWPLTGIADIVSCRAKVANRSYEVELNRDSGQLSVATDNGYTFKAPYSHSYNPPLKYHFYFIQRYWNRWLGFRVDARDPSRWSICLQENECYLCR